MSRYRSTYRCKVCGFKFSHITRKAPSVDDPCPPCPNLDCGEIQTRIGMDIASGKAPGLIGENVAVKAYDETAKIVMQDHGMTDLHDTNLREGDVMRPKLPPAQQQAADNFFGAPRQKNVVPMRGAMSGAVQQAVVSALAGGARQELFGASTPIADIHRRRLRTPTITLNRGG